MITIIIIIVTMRIFVSDLLADLPGSSKKTEQKRGYYRVVEKQNKV